MKSKYYFCRPLGAMSRQDAVFVVYLGTGYRDQLSLARLQVLSTNQGYFFERVSDETVGKLQAIADNLWQGNQMAWLNIPKYVVSATELLSMVNQGTLSMYHPVDLNHRSWHSILNAFGKATLCYAFLRKNLSEVKLTEGQRAAISAIVMIIMFLWASSWDM